MASQPPPSQEEEGTLRTETATGASWRPYPALGARGSFPLSGWAQQDPSSGWNLGRWWCAEGAGQALVSIGPARPVSARICCVTGAEPLLLAGPQFPHLQTGSAWGPGSERGPQLDARSPPGLSAQGCSCVGEASLTALLRISALEGTQGPQSGTGCAGEGQAGLSGAGVSGWARIRAQTPLLAQSDPAGPPPAPCCFPCTKQGWGGPNSRSGSRTAPLCCPLVAIWAHGSPIPKPQAHKYGPL